MDPAKIKGVLTRKGTVLQSDYTESSNNAKGVWTLAFRQPPDVSDGLTFQYLGSGAIKHVFRVYHNKAATNWVLAFQSNERDRNPLPGFQGEVRTLNRLGQEDDDPKKPGSKLRGCRVPLPFPYPGTGETAGDAALFQFTIENFESGSPPTLVWALVIEYFNIGGTFKEMNKLDGNTKGFMEECFNLDRVTAKKNVKKTRETFDPIKRKWAAKTWGDFQVLYGKQTGEIVVFDPLPTSTAAAIAIVNTALAQWETDIASLEKK